MKASTLQTQMHLHPQIQQQLQLQMFHRFGMVCGAGNQLASLIQQIPVFSDPESDLTANLSGSARKRPREEETPPTMMVMPPTSNVDVLINNQLQRFLSQKHQLNLHDALPTVHTTRPNNSAMASTSGRPPIATTQHSLDTATYSSSSGLISMLHNHTLEIDALVRLHAQKLRSGLDEARKRQCRAAVAALEQEARRRVAEKQAQLDAATTRNAELQDRLRQAVAESQAWFDVARNSEELIATLRASLDHALLQKLADSTNKANDNNHGTLPTAAATAEEQEEGYGDSEEEAAASSSSSSAVAAATTNNPAVVPTGCFLPCKSCGGHDATVLLLPCRHLCLCPSCDPSVAECPMCRCRKNATLNINLS